MATWSLRFFGQRAHQPVAPAMYPCLVLGP